MNQLAKRLAARFVAVALSATLAIGLVPALPGIAPEALQPQTAYAATASTVVYTTRTGSCYHLKGCSSLRKSAYKTTLAKAKAAGYTACKRCNPPKSYGSSAKRYSIKYVTNGGTLAKGSPKSYAYGKGATLKSPTRKGYVFKGWYTSKSYKTRVTRVSKTAKGTKTYYAKWAGRSYSIKYVTNGGTLAKGSPKSYVHGRTVKLKSPTRKGYKFKGWYTSKSYRTRVTKVSATATGSRIYYAKWAKA